jgi:hypothetical protein
VADDSSPEAIVVLVAYDCDPRSGLQRICIGEADYNTRDGLITWRYREDLPLRTMRRAHLAPVADKSDESFDDAPEPSLPMALREREQENPGSANR